MTQSQQSIEPSRQHRWVLSSAAGAWAIGGVILLVVGLITRRSDVAILGVPLIVGLVWTWIHRPSGAAQVQIYGASMAQPGEVRAQVDLEATPGVGTGHLRVRAQGYRATEVLVDLAQPRTIELAMWTVRTGRRAVFDIDYLSGTADNLLRSGPLSAGPIEITVLPKARPVRELPLPFRLQGMTGPHVSRRPGDGDDLHDIDLFRPGDRLRRIDWRVTARRLAPGLGVSDLYVRRTLSMADASVMLVLDSRDDIGPDVATWGDSAAVRQDEATSLDLAREAAASIARRYLDLGDRVGLEDLGRLRRPVAPAGGRQQFHRLAQQLAWSVPEGEPKPRRRPPRLPSGALILVFSTFLDDEAARLAQIWRHAGHRVVAIDVLPTLVTHHLTSRLATAHRIVAMERNDRLTELSRTGVELVRWHGDPAAGSAAVDVALTALARTRTVRR